MKRNDDNFFIGQEEVSSSAYVSETSRRLNDYDLNILKDEAYKEVTDELFKLEYRISKVENSLKEVEAQIQVARDIKDYVLLESLFSRKNQLEEDLKILLEIYSDSSLSAKISGSLLNIIPKSIREHFSFIKKFGESFNERFLSLLPKQYVSGLEIRKSLEKLKKISKNVDELMTLQTPYGEAQDKYEQLSKYIVKANNIQAEISKYLR